MKFIETELPGVIIIEPKIYGDDRGYFCEVYRRDLFALNGIHDQFCQDNVSRSNKGTIRGLHFQLNNPQAKLVMVTRGTVLDVAVDVRVGSPTYGRSTIAELSEENKKMLYIPEGFAHGFLVLSEIADFQYKCSNYYDPKSEKTILWSDPELEIPWNIDNPILSEKDKKAKLLKEYNNNELPKYYSSR